MRKHHSFFLRLLLDCLRPGLGLVFDLETHLAAFLFQHDQLFVLRLHDLFVLSLLELKLAQTFLRHPQLLTKLADLRIVLTLFI